MTKIDWSKVGKRIRFQPKDQWGKNPDWNLVDRRWKDEADYYADELDKRQVIALVACPVCAVPRTVPCRDTLVDFHMPRKRAAGEAILASHGPRVS